MRGDKCIDLCCSGGLGLAKVSKGVSFYAPGAWVGPAPMGPVQVTG